MRRFEIVQSTTETTTSHAGLALVGRGLAMTGLDRELRQIPLRHGIAHADCVKSYVGLLCTGKSDFDAIENKRNDTFFITALGIERVPSAPSLRQRFDEDAEAMTVMQELVYVAARVVESGRRLALKFSRHCPAFPSFEAVYGKLAAG